MAVRRLRGRLHPPGVPQRRWFEHVLSAFRTVELDVTFYRAPLPA